MSHPPTQLSAALVPHIYCGFAFQIIELDPALGALSPEGYALSPHGQQVAGSYCETLACNLADPIHAFVRTPSGFFGSFPSALFPWAFTRRDAPGEPATSGRGINDHGDLVGFYRDPNGAMHGYVWWDADPAPMTLDLQGADFPPDNLIHNAVFAINNAGYVAGTYTPGKPNAGRLGFVTDAHDANAAKARVFTPVDCLGLDANATNVIVRGINSQRDIVGRYNNGMGDTHGYVSLDAANGYADCRDIAIPGARSTIVTGINDAGQIVGEFLDMGGNKHGFLGRVDSAGQFSFTIDVKIPDEVFKGAINPRLNGVDNQGVMLGTFDDATGNSYPFLCWYGCSRGVALGAWPWAWPLGRIPPPPSPFMASTPGYRAMLGLYICDLLEGLEDASTRRRIRQPLLESVMREVGSLGKADRQHRSGGQQRPGGRASARARKRDRMTRHPSRG